MKMSIDLEIRLPMTPNFLLTDGRSIPIDEFTDEQLKAIGEAWVKRLLEVARDRRLKKAT